MTSDNSPDLAYVWIWLPVATQPIVAGALTRNGNRFIFNYGSGSAGHRSPVRGGRRLGCSALQTHSGSERIVSSTSPGSRQAVWLWAREGQSFRRRYVIDKCVWVLSSALCQKRTLLTNQFATCHNLYTNSSTFWLNW